MPDSSLRSSRGAEGCSSSHSWRSAHCSSRVARRQRPVTRRLACERVRAESIRGVYDRWRSGRHELRRHGGGAVRRGRSDRSFESRRRVPTGSVGRRRGDGLVASRSVTGAKRGTELCGLRRLLGWHRKRRLRPRLRSVGDLRPRRKRVPDLALDLRRQGIHIRSARLQVAGRRRDLGSTKTLIRDSEHRQLQRQGVDCLTADPTRSGAAGNVYAVWDRFAIPGENRSFNSLLHSFAFRGQPVFSRTTDGGQTWSTPVAMTNQNLFTIGKHCRLAEREPDRRLLRGGRARGKQPSPNQIFEGAMISTDAGLSWSPPISIASFVPVAGCPPEDVCDPDTNQPVRAGTNVPDVAVELNSGAIYVVWADGRFSGGTKTDVVLSRSTDGGKKWSTPHQARYGIGNLAGVHARGCWRFGQRCGGRHVLRLPEHHGCSWAPDGYVARDLAGRRSDMG